ncbi:MAG: TolB-like protein [Gammaproteobacteria bacterium]|jgi:TolB-like protein
MNGLFEELKHRNVFRVGIAYLALTWLVIQITNIAVPALNLPETLNSIVFYLGLIGFPFALLLAWAFELTPDGLKRSSDVADDASIRADSSRKLNYVVIAMLVFIAAIALWQGQSTPAAESGESKAATIPADNSPAKAAASPSKAASDTIRNQHSIAVLPFVNMSSDPEQEYFSDGLSEELLNLLAQIRELKVTGRTSSFAFKGRNEDLRKIGEQLNVATVLEGSVRRSGNRLRITAQLIKVEDGFHLWSETYDREMTDVFAIQDEIAAKIVAALHVKLELPIPLRGLPTTNMEAYQLFLEAKALAASEYYRMLDAVEILKRAVKLDPEFAEAHEYLANLYANFIGSGQGTEKEYQPLVTKHANTALSIDPKRVWAKALAETTASSFITEESLRQIENLITAQPQNSDAQFYGTWLLLALGYYEEALKEADSSIAQDPFYMNHYMQRSHALRGLGRTEEATNAIVFWFNGVKQYTGLNVIALRSSFPEGSRGLVNAYAEKTDQNADAVFTFLKRVADPVTRIDALDDPMNSVYLGIHGSGHGRLQILARFQDARFWPELEKYAATGGTLLGAFVPIMSTKSRWVINDPRFRSVAEEIGVVDHWRNNKLPDFCDGTFESWICELHDER